MKNGIEYETLTCYVFESDDDDSVNGDDLSSLSDVFDDDFSDEEILQEIEAYTVPSVVSMSIDDIPYDREVKWINVPNGARGKVSSLAGSNHRIMKNIQSNLNSADDSKNLDEFGFKKRDHEKKTLFEVPASATTHGGDRRPRREPREPRESRNSSGGAGRTRGEPKEDRPKQRTERPPRKAKESTAEVVVSTGRVDDGPANATDRSRSSAALEAEPAPQQPQQRRQMGQQQSAQANGKLYQHAQQQVRQQTRQREVAPKVRGVEAVEREAHAVESPEPRQQNIRNMNKSAPAYEPKQRAQQSIPSQYQQAVLDAAGAVSQYPPAVPFGGRPRGRQHAQAPHNPYGGYGEHSYAHHYDHGAAAYGYEEQQYWEDPAASQQYRHSTHGLFIPSHSDHYSAADVHRQQHEDQLPSSGGRRQVNGGSKPRHAPAVQSYPPPEPPSKQSSTANLNPMAYEFVPTLAAPH